MRIRNANIYTEEHRFVRGDAAVENGRFVSCTGDPAGEEAVVDAKGMYLIPGLVDIHFHGCKGADMCDGTKEALDVITSYEASVGVTSVCPATMTIPKDELLEVMKMPAAMSIPVDPTWWASIWKDLLSVRRKRVLRLQKISCTAIMNISVSCRKRRTG